MTEKKRPSVFYVGPAGRKPEAAAARAEKTKEGKKEVWLLTSGGTEKVVVTSAASLTVMDQTVSLFSSALESLAKR